MDEIWTCDIVRVEIESGILGLKNETTREKQLAWWRENFSDLPSRALDWLLCQRAIALAGRARRRGYAVTCDDAFVGATADELGARIATANVQHFQHLGLDAYDPLENRPGQAST